ncbi:unnamed protein product [Mytilus edulis]|uniref:Uncharacterized protein n=1 Tax=Mytilus edulis TaxID=6550 RepID=A0A8S3UK18_MYTED|nr:unnamed protein product [Mytilus edulis]
MNELKLPTLENRRRHSRLTFLYKVAGELVPAIPQDSVLVKERPKRQIKSKQFRDYKTTYIVDKFAQNNSRCFNFGGSHNVGLIFQRLSPVATDAIYTGGVPISSVQSISSVPISSVQSIPSVPISSVPISTVHSNLISASPQLGGGILPYLTGVKVMFENEKVINILQNPIKEKIGCLPPVKPNGGDIYLIQSKHPNDWKCDQYMD